MNVALLKIESNITELNVFGLIPVNVAAYSKWVSLYNLTLICRSKDCVRLALFNKHFACFAVVDLSVNFLKYFRNSPFSLSKFHTVVKIEDFFVAGILRSQTYSTLCSNNLLKTFKKIFSAKKLKKLACLADPLFERSKYLNSEKFVRNYDTEVLYTMLNYDVLNKAHKCVLERAFRNNDKYFSRIQLRVYKIIINYK